MIPAFIALVLLLQLAGEALVRALGIPIPGPVIGMILLLVILIFQGGPPKPLQALADGLLNHLSLLFIPAGAGVISYLALLADNWLAVLLTISISTILAIVVTAFTLKFLLRRMNREDS